MIELFLSKMPPIQLVIDWDCTLTKEDTLLVLASIGYDAHSSISPPPKLWSWVVESYLQDYKVHKDSYVPKLEQRKSIEQESSWLASLQPIERRSFERFKKLDLFGGVSEERMFAESSKAVRDQKVILRHGWEALFMLAVDEPNAVDVALSLSILSVSWSSTFILGCLIEGAKKLHSTDQEDILQIVKGIRIYSNELLSIESDRRQSRIHTSSDKLQTLQEVAEKGRSLVYVGDSVTDFDALLLADVGICIRDVNMTKGQTELDSTFRRVGVDVKHLSEVETVESAYKLKATSQQIVWWTTSLSEIASFLVSSSRGKGAI
jgi:thiamine phosphate phosphatase / amino-HMP aminohydrolase